MFDNLYGRLGQSQFQCMRSSAPRRVAVGILRSLIGTLAVTSLLAQSPIVQITNVTRPGNSDFKVGDRFEIVIAGAANKPISVRTTFNGRTDWSPVVAQTNADGQW